MSAAVKMTVRRGLIIGAVTAVPMLAAGTGRVSAEPTVISATRATATTPKGAGPAGRIKHVVVIFQENHSFDETLGQFCRLHVGRGDGYVGPVEPSDGTVVSMR